MQVKLLWPSRKMMQRLQAIASKVSAMTLVVWAALALLRRRKMKVITSRSSPSKGAEQDLRSRAPVRNVVRFSAVKLVSLRTWKYIKWTSWSHRSLSSNHQCHLNMHMLNYTPNGSRLRWFVGNACRSINWMTKQMIHLLTLGDALEF